jgi:hypothetical protein
MRQMKPCLSVLPMCCIPFFSHACETFPMFLRRDSYREQSLHLFATGYCFYLLSNLRNNAAKSKARPKQTCNLMPLVWANSTPESPELSASSCFPCQKKSCRSKPCVLGPFSLHGMDRLFSLRDSISVQKRSTQKLPLDAAHMISPSSSFSSLTCIGVATWLGGTLARLPRFFG